VEKKCLKCDMAFETVTQYNSHASECNSNVKRSQFDCNQCDSKWNSAEVLVCHLSNDHDCDDVVCDVCAIILKSSNYLKYHKNSIHEDIKRFSCTECTRRFATNCSMQDHIKIKHRRIGNFNCDQCAYKCLNKSSFERHMTYTHADKDTIQLVRCEICDRGFKEVRCLKKHRLRVHMGVKVK
jgi:hypothetical protein